MPAVMASTNVELLEQALAAVNARDVDGFAALMADDFEWVTPLAPVGPGSYYGREGVREFFEVASEVNAKARIDTIRDLGDRALLLGAVSWRHGDGPSLQRPFAAVAHLEHGRLKRIHSFRDANDAWNAAGLGRPRH